MRRKTTKSRAVSKKSSPTGQSPRFDSELDNPVALASIHVDAIIERISTHKLKKFDESGLAQLRKLTDQQLVLVNKYYKRTWDDMKCVLKKEPDFVEAYRCWSKEQVQLVAEYLKALKALKPDANASGKIRVSRPRQERKKSPDVIVRKVLYMEKDSDTKQTSLHPRVLVGAAELWVYNTKTRKLGCYYAKTDAGLSAKGTTILNYDEDRSTTKTIRKPEQQVLDFLKAGKKYWTSIKAVPQVISPRMNRDTIILRALDF